MSETTLKIRSFIVDTFMFGDEDGFAYETSLMEAGIMDSTGVLELVAFLENEFGINVEDEELIPENLDSLDALSRYVARKLKKA